MEIKWGALAGTAGVSFGITVAVVAVFALGSLALARRDAAREAAAAGGPGQGAGGGVLAAAAAVCFAACAAAVGYGIYLIAAR
ncbi:hypothetical protein LO771_11010 [Streptacidiphilus sp. ASG 303]|uniref:hypothetical protein n=1 Tax=Streptacidiphilus sp. ASG 303 TaxID=2896847 RepID=UPI001E2DA15D|nr:hypothetical protein [Streptacidiphilus sp. ASG 303]MCD0482914.1 hypothetical protein [Streptacidiphilus sp. ASG 303]